MAKSNITKKRSLNIKGVVDICKEDNTIYVSCEDNAEAFSLADLLQDFDGAEVTISVTESVDLA